MWSFFTSSATQAPSCLVVAAALAFAAPAVADDAKPDADAAHAQSSQQSADQKIADRIAKHLSASGKLKGFDIEIEYAAGGATLSGTVAAESQRQLALDLADECPDVNKVVDRLSIAKLSAPQRRTPARLASGSQPAPQPSNQEVADEIAGLLRDSGELHGYSIKVKYALGVAALSGTVAGDDQRKTAIDLANAHPSVKRVSDQLQVMTLSRPAAPAARQKLVPQAAPKDAAAQLAARAVAEPAEAEEAKVMAAPIAYAATGAAEGPQYDQPYMPPYAWPTYSPYPNYSTVTYPRQYCQSAWPYIGPFYPYPQVPLGWRKVKLEWDDGWWFLKFKKH